MLLKTALDQRERVAELCMQVVRGITSDVEAAAPERAVLPECRYHDMAARSHCGADLIYIPLPIAPGREKVKDGPVVPYIEGSGRERRA